MIRRRDACPRFEALSEALLSGSSAGVLGHARGCPRCSRTIVRIEAASAAVRGLRPRPLRPERLSRIAEALAAAPDRRSRWRREIFLAGAAIAVTASLVALLLVPVLRARDLPAVSAPAQGAPRVARHAGEGAHGELGPVARATVIRRGEARFEHVFESPAGGAAAPMEIVRLADGVIDVQVERLSAGQRFLVATGDAQVEVRGTRFEVEARDHRLVRVSVVSGRVEVRPAGRPSVLLAAGESWRARAVPARPAVRAARVRPSPGPPAREPPAVPSLAAPVPAPVPPPEPAPAPTPAGQERFLAGWRALEAGDLELADAAFAAAVASDPGGELAEPARYGRCIALHRAGSPRARGALEAYLFEHPDSPHDAELSAILGVYLLRAGDREGAEQRFRQALDAPSEAVRESARAGLRALGR